MAIKPWVHGPFDLLRHGEEHRQGSRDFDRRIALISFDNAIEMAVVTYLDLNPAQRGGLSYRQEDVTHWKRNFHTKLEFIERFTNSKGTSMLVQRDEMIYYHGLRNDLYHGGNGTVPALHAIEGARRAALWIVTLLFDVDAGALLSEDVDLALAQIQPASPETEFLGQFLDIKKTLDEVLNVLHATVAADSSLGERMRVVPPEARLQTLASRVTAEAELIKQRLVEGQPTGISDTDLQSLTEQLGSLSSYYRERLRAYQLDLIEAAFGATLRKRSTGGIAGLIQQPVGSGITSSMIGYLARCRESGELGSIPQIVIVDRLVLAEQLIQSVRQAPNDGEALDVVRADSREELYKLLLDSRPRLVVATQQSISMLEKTIPHTCLVVGLSLASIESAAQVWLRMFPQGIFIAFSSHHERRTGMAWVPLIAEYSMQQATSDGHMRPVAIELRDGVVTDSVRLLDASDAIVAAYARQILEDFAVRVGSGIFLKGIVITDSGMATHRLLKTLAANNAATSLANLQVHALGQTDNPNHVWQTFHNGDEPQLLVSTYRRLVGADTGSDTAYYVTCFLSTSFQTRITAMAGRPGRDASVHGLIVDLAGNHWGEKLSGE
ncbi:hypothetical protein VC273_16480 [Xanthomonas nasturtii]|uniref:hypothetical protein n=1 Tax=Xanthomonas TaxID=338 RepID=UPI002B23428A|nr:hypothetical protein [Xanthomonas nasturtii]MEA9557443.1 hypothetical protein [Xanthomonas nasturtii]